MRLWDGGEGEAPEKGLWDGVVEVELPRWSCGMELWDEVSRDEALDGAVGVKLPR